MLSAVMAGCNPTHGVSCPVERSMTRDCWRLVERQGGLAHELELDARVSSVTDRLLSHQCDRVVRTCVIECDDLRAYAWSNGWVMVSRGLAEADEELLAAAIAHELGHLLVDKHLPMNDPDRLTALIGTKRPAALDPEVAADRVGLGLMRLAGYDATALHRLLVELRTDASIHPALRRDIDQRIAGLGPSH